MISFYERLCKDFFFLHFSYYCNSLKLIIISKDSFILLSPCSFNLPWSCLCYCFFVLKLASYPLDLLIGVLPSEVLGAASSYHLTMCSQHDSLYAPPAFLFFNLYHFSHTSFFQCIELVLFCVYRRKMPSWQEMSLLILFSISSMYFIKIFFSFLNLHTDTVPGLFQDF